MNHRSANPAEKLLESLLLRGLRQVMIEACRDGAAAVLFLAPACQGDDQHRVAARLVSQATRSSWPFMPGIPRSRIATSGMEARADFEC